MRHRMVSNHDRIGDMMRLEKAYWSSRHRKSPMRSDITIPKDRQRGPARIADISDVGGNSTMARACSVVSARVSLRPWREPGHDAFEQLRRHQARQPRPDPMRRMGREPVRIDPRKLPHERE